MATLTIRNIDEELKTLLRAHAAQHGCSMAQEVRDILQSAVSSKHDQVTFAQKIRQHFSRLDVDELPIPERKTPRVASASRR